MEKQKFIAESYQGKLVFDDPTLLEQFLVGNEGSLVVTIERPVKIRSNPQNRYGHGISIKKLAEHLGWTVGQVKEYAKVELGFVEVKKIGTRVAEVPRSSATFTTIEWEETMRFIRQIGDENGIYIPEPNEN